jgi:hypothetical protein
VTDKNGPMENDQEFRRPMKEDLVAFGVDGTNPSGELFNKRHLVRCDLLESATSH